MRVMCLNGWGGKLFENLAPYFRGAQPDVLCLQEVVHSPKCQKEWLTYRDGEHILPQRANFFDDVSELLPDHTAIFCPAAQGVLWDGEDSVPSQWGLATFVHKSFPIIGQTQGFVHKDFSPHDYGEHPRSRNAHVVRLFDYEAGSPVTIGHMHGLRDPNGKMDTPERLIQAQRFIALIESVAPQDDGVIVCGDFNVEPESKTLGLLKQRGMKELVTANGFAGTRSSHYSKPNRFADYMLVNERVAVQSFSVVSTPEVSDHLPLQLET